MYDYNGWSNRETWLVNVWFSPESEDDVEIAKSQLEWQLDMLPNGVLKDMIDLSLINWDELREAVRDVED